MNLNRKKIAILIIASALVLLILFIYFGFRKSHQVPVALAPVVTSTPVLPYSLPASTSSSQVVASSTKPQYDINKEAPHQVTGDDLGKIAMAFSERLGTFSNQSAYGNINDLKLSMTDSMQTWANTYIQQLATKYKNDGKFYSITTHALLYKVLSFDQQAGRAKIVVTTQRQVQNAKLAATKPYNQKINFTFLKVQGRWLVDAAYWQR